MAAEELRLGTSCRGGGAGRRGGGRGGTTDAVSRGLGTNHIIAVWQVAVAEVASAEELDVTNLAGRKLGESEMVCVGCGTYQ